MAINQPKTTVLVADDWPDSADAMAIMLSLEGFETIVAHDGEQTIEIIRERRPEVAILDLAMPKISGLEIAKRLCASQGKRPLLIARSGHCTSVDIENSLAAGFDHFLAKPVNHAELLAILHAHHQRLGRLVHG